MRSLHHLLLLAALVATTSAALAQERGPRGGGPGFAPSGAMLLGQKSVQEDLQLSEEQVKQVAEFAAKQRESFSGLRDASREERTKRFNEGREAGQKIVETILNEEQRSRLEQISLQFAGPAAFASPKVAEKLAFSDEQKKSIEEIQSGHREEMRSLMQGDGDRAEAFRKMQAARQATEGKLQGLLNDEQKTKWQELTGKKFEGQLEGPGGRGFGRGRRGNQDAKLRRENDTTVLTADKSEEEEKKGDDAGQKDAGQKDAGQKDAGQKDKHVQEKAGKEKAKQDGDAKARHRTKRPQDREHAARHQGRGPPRQAHHRHAYHRHGHDRHAVARHFHHRRGPGQDLAQRGHHRHPQARFAHHGYRPQFGGQFHGRHFAHRGPQPRHHQGPGHHFGPGSDARRHAWNRVSLAMGTQHGPRSFSHVGPRHHGHRGPHHFAHRGHELRRAHHAGPPHFAHGSRRGAGQEFRAWPHHGRNDGHFAAHHRGPRHGHDERHMSGLGGPDRPNFAWQFDRHREDGPGFEPERGPRGPHPRVHPAGFKKRQHDAGDERHGKDGDHKKRHSKRHDEKKAAFERDGDKDREKDSGKSDKED